MAPGELDELAHARAELALLRRRDDRDAPTAPDLEQTLVTKLPKSIRDGVFVLASNSRHGDYVLNRAAALRISRTLRPVPLPQAPAR